MMTSRAPTIGRTPAGRPALRVLGMLALLVGAGADPFRPAPKFEGKAIPDPPRQGEPWTPPETKLPRFLVTATAALFEAGMADPRGCEYREVEVGGAGPIKTRGFVLPERAGEAGRFVVGWDGVIVPAFAVAAGADLEADVRALARAMKEERSAGNGGAGFAAGGRYRGPFFDGGMPATAEGRSALKLCMLLRLGRADLAEALFAAGTRWTPDTPRRDLTNYRISYLTLAAEWAGIVDSRLLAAHQRGDDVVALDAARRLAAFQKAVDARAEAMGFLRGDPRPGGTGPASYLGSFDQLPALLADQERRAHEPPRGPIPGRGGDPSARVAALIRDFDQIHVVQYSSPGSANPGGAPVVRELIAEGDAAVEPLLAALESDTRLTRSVTGGRGGGPGAVHPVTDAVYAALVGILKTGQFLERGEDYTALRTPEGRKRLAAAARAFWEKNRAVPLVERWYRTLRDNSAGTNRWLAAAAGMIQPQTEDGLPFSGFAYATWTGRAGGSAMKGEPYRGRRDPSVSELLARRTGDIARAGNPASVPDVDLIRAGEMAAMFARWDEPAALPTLSAVMATCRDRSLRGRQDNPSDVGYGRSIARLTLLRVRAGDRAALDEYAAWVRAIPPRAMRDSLSATLEPLWTYPEHPAVAAAARAMFLDPGSPWLPLVPREPGQILFPFEDPVASPLTCVAEFREALLAALTDRATAGTARRLEQGGMEYRMTSGATGSVGGMRAADADVRPDVEVTFRACDVVAWKLSALDGAPECMPYWPEPRRDAAVTACAAYLRRYGPGLSPEAPPGERDFPHARAHLRFNPLGRAATAEDVGAGRAIFALEGEGEARPVTMPEPFPIRARWVALRTFPIDRQLGDGSTRREYLQDGWVWQAEEVRKEDRWERSYGFVGHATIARAPASEVEFPPGPYPGPSLPDGLDAQLAPAAPAAGGILPGRPVVLTLRLRNCRGVERPVPTEFLRRADDGKPALRRGVDLALHDVPKGPAGSVQGGPSRGVERKPARMARFDPGGATRMLAPAGSFEAMQVDINDWFTAPGPGSYRVHLTFTNDSGVGEGTTNDVFFTIADPDERPH